MSVDDQISFDPFFVKFACVHNVEVIVGTSNVSLVCRWGKLNIVILVVVREVLERASNFGPEKSLSARS